VVLKLIKDSLRAQAMATWLHVEMQIRVFAFDKGGLKGGFFRDLKPP